MNILRNSLIVFGWVIPIVTFVLIASNSYVAIRLGGFGHQAGMPLWSIMIANITNGIQHLALSPLCFFGAFMLDKKLRSPG